MKKLEYKGRYQPLYEATLDEWITDIKFTPFTKSSTAGLDRSWLHVSHTSFNNKPLGGWIHFKPSAALIEAISGRSIFRAVGDTDGSNIAEEHNMEIIETPDGYKLLYGFSKISGSYALSMISREELFSWLRKAVAGKELEQHEWLMETSPTGRTKQPYNPPLHELPRSVE